MVAGFTSEVVLTGCFLFIILGATHKKAHPALAPVAIDTGDESLGESGPQPRPGGRRGRLGARSSLALLGGAFKRGLNWQFDLFVA